MDKQVPATKLEFSEHQKYIDSIVGQSIWPDCISIEVLWFIGCQFALESNYGRSRIAIEQHNHCGMKKPSQRITFADLSSPLKFASYSSLEDCVCDYFAWLCFNKFSQASLSDLSLFKVKLQLSGYCPEKGYISRIESIFNQTFPINLFNS